MGDGVARTAWACGEVSYLSKSDIDPHSNAITTVELDVHPRVDMFARDELCCILDVFPL